MPFALIGVSYREAGEEDRALAAFSDSDKLAFIEAVWQEGIDQIVILSTCHRSEIYFCYEEEAQKKAVEQHYVQKAACHIPYRKTDEDAICHLFKVGAGYYSMIPGEDQIEHQLQQAYSFSCQLGACKKTMHTIFQQCFHHVKMVRARYHISECPMSLPYIAVKYLKQQQQLENASILVIGNGTMAQLMVRYILQEAVKEITICCRDVEKAAAMFDDARIQLRPFTQRYAILPHCPIIISATAAPHLVLEYEKYPKRTISQLCIDLAMPHDIDRRIRTSQVTIMGIDDFAQVKDENIQKRRIRLQSAKQDLQAAAQATYQSLQQEPRNAVVSSLHQLSEESAQAAYEMIIAKIKLPSHEQKMIKNILTYQFHHMVKEPVKRLSKKSSEQEDYLRTVKELFAIKEEA